jgi:hypothetical protein
MEASSIKLRLIMNVKSPDQSAKIKGT